MKILIFLSAGPLLFVLLITGCGMKEKTAGEALVAGQQALGQHKFREALRHFRRASDKAPSSSVAHAFRGVAGQVLGEFDEALEGYRTAAQLDPNSDNYLRIGVIAERIGDFGLAQASLASALQGSEEGELRIAQYLFRVTIESGNPTTALELAQNGGWVGAGVDYCQSHQVRLSEETQQLLAMLIHPQNAPCLFTLGRALTEDGLVNFARLVLMEFIKNSSEIQARGEAEAFLQHRLPAQDVVKRAESLNVAGYNLQYSIGDGEEAVKAYQKAIAADPSFSWPYHNIAQVHLSRGDQKEAITWFRKAVAVNPNHWKAQYNLGLLASDMKLYDEAVTAHRAAVALKPDEALGHAHLALALVSIGQEAEASQEMRTAVQLNPRIQQDVTFMRSKL